MSFSFFDFILFLGFFLLFFIDDLRLAKREALREPFKTQKKKRASDSLERAALGGLPFFFRLVFSCNLVICFFFVVSCLIKIITSLSRLSGKKRKKNILWLDFDSSTKKKADRNRFSSNEHFGCKNIEGKKKYFIQLNYFCGDDGSGKNNENENDDIPHANQNDEEWKWKWKTAAIAKRILSTKSLVAVVVVVVVEH